MRRVLTIAITSLALCAALGAQSIDPTAATVKLTKTETISVRALTKEIATYEAAAKQSGQDLTDKQRSDVLWLLIDRILFQQAAERDHVRVSQDVLQTYIEQTRQVYSQQLGRTATDTDLRAVATQQGLSWDQWLDKLRVSALPEVYVTQTRTAVIQNVDTPTDAEIRRYYRANLTQFTIGDIVEFKHIFVSLQGKTTKEARDAARAKIDDVARRLRAGESYEDLVVKYSEDAKTAKTGGYSGHIQVDKADIRQALGEDFVDAIFDLDEGQVSGVLQSSQGYHIVKILKKIPGKLYTLDEMTPPDYKVTPRSAIRDAIILAKRQEALYNEITKVKQELRAQAKIDVLDKNLGFQYQKPS